MHNETLIIQMEDKLNLVAVADAPYMLTQIVTYAYNSIFQTGLFAAVCQEWHRQQEAYKMRDQLKMNLSLAHQEFCETHLNKQTAVYHLTNIINRDMLEQLH